MATSCRASLTCVSSVVCIGSLNVDLVVRLARMPSLGETVTGHDLERHLGGKGLNQALAAARAGGEVALVGAVGADDGGTWMLEELAQAGIDLTGVSRIDGPSGTALIEVDDSGANRIVVIPGANGWLTSSYTSEQVLRLGSPRIALAPLEIPPASVLGALTAARQAGMRTILNTAPVPPDGIPEGMFDVTDVAVANEHEATLITGVRVDGIESAYAAARALRELGAGSAIVTLGGDGAAWSTPEAEGHTPAFPVTPIDTVAAGDAFCGVLAASLAAGMTWEHGVLRASAAGALATTVRGAAPSLPSAESIDNLVSTREES
jgi:ribokinase